MREPPLMTRRKIVQEVLGLGFSPNACRIMTWRLAPPTAHGSPVKIEVGGLYGTMIRSTSSRVPELQTPGVIVRRVKREAKPGSG
jgi:hypothetical protein